MKTILKIQKKAFSLLEVLIMLVVVSLTMVSAMALVAKASIGIKNNEVLDLVNGVMFKSIELLKSPAPVYLSADGYTQLQNFTGTDEYFSLRESGSTKYLQYDVNNGANFTDDCGNPGDFYYYPVTFGSTTQNLSMCLEIIIERDPTNYYIITTNVVYNLNGTPARDTLKTYRYDLFIPKP